MILKRIRKLIRQLELPAMSLQANIIATFLILFILTIFFIIAIRSISYIQALRYTSFKIIQYAADNVLNELHDVVNPVKLASEITSKLIGTHVLNPKDIAQMDNYLFNLSKSLQLVEGVFYGDQNGDMIFTEKEGNLIRTDFYNRSRLPQTLISVYRDAEGHVIRKSISYDLKGYDPRLRPWYIKAVNEKETVWSGTYRLANQYYLAFASATPAYVNNNLQGVFGLDVTLQYLNNFIKKQKVATRGISFIISADEKLIAYSKTNIAALTNYKIQSDGSFNFVDLKIDKIPIISDSIKLFKKTGQRQFLITHKGEKYLVYYAPVNELRDFKWLVGVIVPQSDFIGALRRENVTTLIISLITMLLGIFLVSKFISRALKPIHTLVDETKRIKNFELDHPISISSNIKEIIQLTEAINSMKLGLKQFQRYVPEELVKQLIASGEDVRIGGIKRDLVIFFSDIQGFTTLSETSDPRALTVQLCEYFESLSQIILREKGTIDKYIGDSMMVFWGAPIREKHPCTHAANAALACQEKIAELNAQWNKEGKPSLITRIGIHYGEAIVGNMGSTGRVNYTAIGDTINTASRLEQINKVYGTRISVSESVYNILKNKYLFRMLDFVAVKGRSEKIRIYELLGQLDTKLPFDLNAYKAEFKKGFNAYTSKNWEQAQQYFENCLKIYPKDKLAIIFIKKVKLRV